MTLFGYGNYLNKINIDGKDYYIRFTVQRQKNESGLHSSFVSNVELYNNPAIDASNPSSNGGRKLDYDRITDAKLKTYFDKSKENVDKFSQLTDNPEYTKIISDSESRMREILDEVKREKGYSDDSSYQGTSAFNGAAPSRNGYFETKEEQAKAEAENKEGLIGKARIIAMFNRFKDMLSKYWQMARDVFAGNNAKLKDKSAEDFADMAMADLMHGTNPLDAANAKNKGGRNARSERSSRTGEDVEREAKANGTWLKAPNGAETNLEEKQWKDVRTDSFKGYFGDWERSYQKDSLMNAEPVSKLEAKKIIAREGQSFIDAVYELFEKQGGKANSPFGEVLLDKKGTKNDVKHGVGVEKNISFASVKDVLEKGIIILPLDYYGTSGKKQKTGIVAAPIAIDGKRYICAVEVIANKENSRLYVHEVFTTEKLHENVVSNQVRGSKTASPHSQGAIAKLLQEIVNSKDNSSKVVDDNGEPLVVYHASPEHGFTTFKDNAFFSKNREYTDRYEKGGDTYEVYLNIRKPFDIRNPKDRKIFTEYRNGHEPARTKSGAMDWAEFDYYDKENEEDMVRILVSK